MPSRNTVRQYDVPAYYHVYNRGAGGGVIFRDAQVLENRSLGSFVPIKNRDDAPGKRVTFD